MEHGVEFISQDVDAFSTSRNEWLNLMNDGSEKQNFLSVWQSFSMCCEILERKLNVYTELSRSNSNENLKETLSNRIQTKLRTHVSSGGSCAFVNLMMQLDKKWFSLLFHVRSLWVFVWKNNSAYTTEEIVDAVCPWPNARLQMYLKCRKLIESLRNHVW